MADKIQPPSKPVPGSDGLKMGSASKYLTTPDPTFGRYFGSDKPGSQAVNSETIMGSKK